MDDEISELRLELIKIYLCNNLKYGTNIISKSSVDAYELN